MLLRNVTVYHLRDAYWYAMRAQAQVQFRKGFERGYRAIIFAANRHCSRTGRWPLSPRQVRVSYIG